MFSISNLFIFFFSLHCLHKVARWKKLTAQVVTTKEKNATNSNNHVGSSITGITLYDKSIRELLSLYHLISRSIKFIVSLTEPPLNIASQLIATGHANSTANVLRLDGGNDEDETVSNGLANSPSTSINGHKTAEIINDVNKNIGFTTSTPTKKDKKVLQPINNGNNINNNGPTQQQQQKPQQQSKSGPTDDRFSKFANKSWHDIVEEDE